MTQIKTAGGTPQTKTQVLSAMTDVTPPENKVYRFDGEDELFQHFTTQGSNTFEDGRQFAFIPGRLYSGADIDRLFPAAVVTSVVPNSGPATGGTKVVIRGQNFGGTTNVKFGGSNGTGLQVVNDNEIQVTTPAGSGTVDVVITDDAGTTTVKNGFTYDEAE